MDFNILGILRAVSKDRKSAAAVILGGVAVLALLTGFLGQFVIFMIIVTELVLSFFIGQFELRQFGIELVTFVTVLSGVLYGPVIGLAVGMVLVTLRFIITKGLGPYVAYCIPMMGVVGLLAGYSASFFGSVATAGIVLSVAYNLVTASLGTLMMHDFFEELLWSGTNLIVNVALFSYVAPIIIGALA